MQRACNRFRFALLRFGFLLPLVRSELLTLLQFPLKFTLDAADPPSIDSQPVDCTTLVPTGVAPAPLDSPGGTGLTQNGSEFHINGKTSSDWAGSCRRVTLRVPAASNPVAFFRFE